MDENDLVRFQHMLDSANAILAFTKGKTRKNLDLDRLLLSGILRELEVIGEAAGKISQSIKDCFPNVPWKQIIGMRNRLIHAYFDIDNDVVWKTVKEFIPTFVAELKKIAKVSEAGSA